MAEIPNAPNAWAALDRFWEDLVETSRPRLKQRIARRKEVREAIEGFKAQIRNTLIALKSGGVAESLDRWESVKVVQSGGTLMAKGEDACRTTQRMPAVHRFLQQWRQEYVYRLCLTLLTEARGVAAKQRPGRRPC